MTNLAPPILALRSQRLTLTGPYVRPWRPWVALVAAVACGLLGAVAGGAW